MTRWLWLLMALLLQGTAWAAGSAVTEQRLALVIGNAAYRNDALDNPVNDARLVAGALKQAGFDVALHENLDRRALVAAMRAFGDRLSADTIAVVYYAGHGLQLRDRNYLIPVDAEIRSEDEIPLAGLDIGFMLGRMSQAKSRINIVILDACRNNPFASRGGSFAQGLAQMDAPLGTLLAYATAPGKLALDGTGTGNQGLYAHHLARQLLTPGMPVEHVFKRVREHVVRATRELQVPWESSSLQGEFAFVPGAIVGVSVAAAPAAPVPLRDEMPKEGDRWRYRLSDQFRLGDIFVTAKVDQVGADAIAESWTTTADAKLRTTRVALAPGFNALPDWSVAPAEFAPYLLAAGNPSALLRNLELWQQVEQVRVPLRATIEREEEVQVAAGRFRAVKLVLRGMARNGNVKVEHAVWYAPAVKRIVKSSSATTVGSAVREAASAELTEFKLN